MAMTAEQLERYSRHILLREIGGQGQQRLLASKVLVVGAGGIGAPAIFYLAAAGVGTIGIADHDTVALSNLQRQVIHTMEDLGRPKTESARAAVEMLNEDVSVVEHRLELDAENAREIVKDYDLVIDGVDNFPSRFAINEACIAARVPLLSAAVGRFSGQLALFAPQDAPGKLPCYRCFVPQDPGDVAPCDAEGVLGAVPGVVGAMAALEAVKRLLNLGESLAGRLIVYEALSSETRTARLPADPACPACAPLRAAGDVHAAE